MSVMACYRQLTPFQEVYSAEEANLDRGIK